MRAADEKRKKEAERQQQAAASPSGVGPVIALAFPRSRVPVQTVSRPVKFFDGVPVVEIIFEVALFIILELALCNERLILAFKTARFPALALFRDPEAALKNFRVTRMNGVKAPQ